MLIVAGITVGAGVLTLNNGIFEGGGGFQYFTWRSVHRLIQMGYLAII